MAWFPESRARRASLASVVTRSAPIALLTALALIAIDGTNAASKKDDAMTAPPGEVRFKGSVLVPVGAHAAADVRSVAPLPPGRIIRRGSADTEKHDPLRTVVALPPPRNAGVRVVLITYD